MDKKHNASRVKTGSKENSILVTRKKIEETKKQCLQIVEKMLDETVTEEWLIDICKVISQIDYMDAIEERNILKLCGYPLCKTIIKMPHQKYHISATINKVYDITERKCFCSNMCYKASNFLKAQLSESPAWLKVKDDDLKITLLPLNNSCGSAGKEVDLGHQRVTEKEIEEVIKMSDEGVASKATISSPYLPAEEIEKCAAQLKKVEIAEKNCNFLKTFATNTKSMNSTNETSVSGNAINHSIIKSSSDTNNKINYEKSVPGTMFNFPADDYSVLDSDDDDDDIDEMFFPDYGDFEIAANICKSKTSKPKARLPVLINPMEEPVELSVISTSVKATQDSFDVIQKTLTSWVTAETLRLILGEEKFEFVKSDAKLQSTANSETEPLDFQKLNKMKHDYVKICLRLDKEKAKEIDNDMVLMEDKFKALGTEEVQVKISEEEDKLMEEKVAMFFKGKLVLPESSFAEKHSSKSNKKGKSTMQQKAKQNSSILPPRYAKSNENVPNCNAETDREPVIPLIESFSQNTVRRQLVADRLKIVYLGILPLVGLHYIDISNDLRKLISSFNLSPTNVAFKPAEWKMIAVILFRMLERKLSTKKEWDKEKCWELWEKTLITFDISLVQIDSMLSYVMDYRRLLKS